MSNMVSYSVGRLQTEGVWMGHAVCMEQTKRIIPVGKAHKKWPFGKSRHRQKDNIKMGLIKEVS
jgi:hypothetical protein